ncbi:hypothetical protein BI380_28040 [Delftia tsuruhatensis]|uniref:Secreted protein n=1 Tax=Delftia tsuruhatensis TaxID=180282 RepID=A0ABN4SRT2_9BURK|nr:hypothetical protein BI380_28040 [Delftia tsuruhatensis]
MSRRTTGLLFFALIWLVSSAVRLFAPRLCTSTPGSRTARTTSITPVTLSRRATDSASAGALTSLRFLACRRVTLVVGAFAGARRTIRLHAIITRSNSAIRFTIKLTQLTRARHIRGTRVGNFISVTRSARLISLDNRYVTA